MGYFSVLLFCFSAVSAVLSRGGYPCAERQYRCENE